MENMVLRMQEWCAVSGMKYLTNIVTALLVFLIGRWVARKLRKLLEASMTKAKTEQTLVSFVSNLSYAAMMTFVILAALGRLGVQTTSFIAVLGAAGLAVGLALQGSLSNFAAGVLLIIFRPFKVGDLIEAAGTMGVVEDINIFTTHLVTPDNKAVIVPNSKLTGDNIVNYSSKGTRRVDLVIGVGYDDDLQKVRKALEEVLAADEKILKDPAPSIAVCELADSSVNFAVRPWVNVADYWDVYFGVQEATKIKFDAEGISIPFPQRDVHLINEQPS